MCYSGRCPFEDYMGDCIGAHDEKKFLEEKFGFYCFMPDSYESAKYLDSIEQEFLDALREYRDAKAVARKLSGRYW